MRDFVCVTGHQQRFSKNRSIAHKTKKEERRTFHRMCCPLLVTFNTAFQTTLINRQEYNNQVILMFELTNRVDVKETDRGSQDAVEHTAV